MDKRTALVLTDDEAAELYRFTQYTYISVGNYPELCRLIARISPYVRESGAAREA